MVVGTCSGFDSDLKGPVTGGLKSMPVETSWRTEARGSNLEGTPSPGLPAWQNGDQMLNPCRQRVESARLLDQLGQERCQLPGAVIDGGVS
jgi:hypothetical protein